MAALLYWLLGIATFALLVLLTNGINIDRTGRGS
jgi:hypothetical protein